MTKIENSTGEPPKKIRRRRKEGGGSPDRLYFNGQTQDAIVAYQNCTDKKEREKLFSSEILPAFQKLVENLINIHKFVSLHDSYDDLKNDCINFLFETLHKFDASRGTNAFSYFNVVAKNWLIIKSKQRAAYSKRNVSLDDSESLSNHDTDIIKEQQIQQSASEIFDTSVLGRESISMLYELRGKLRTENELACVNSIITIFENIQDIDLLNKSAVLVYMRELSGLSPKQLTTAMQSVKKLYKTTKATREESDFEVF